MYAKKLILLFLFALMLTSCKKEDSVSQPSFSAKINGIEFITENTMAKLVADSSLVFRFFYVSGEKNGKYLSVNRTDNDFSLQLPLGILLNDSTVSLGYETDTLSRPFLNMSCNLIISKMDTVYKRVSGRFSGILLNPNLIDTLKITDGSFINIKYELITSH